VRQALAWLSRSTIGGVVFVVGGGGVGGGGVGGGVCWGLEWIEGVARGMVGVLAGAVVVCKVYSGHQDFLLTIEGACVVKCSVMQECEGRAECGLHVKRGVRQNTGAWGMSNPVMAV
jgi:hypothetical protein